MANVFKDSRNYSSLKKIKNDNHSVFRVKKIKNGYVKSIWYAKHLGKNRIEAILETLTQELYRLILPQQPKTRRAISKTTTEMPEYLVLSKELVDFNENFFLFPENNKSVLNNNITGLAAAQVLALWLNEVDFKAGNVGIDKRTNKVIKIDGGLSLIKLNPKFKYLYKGKNLDITQADLDALPNLVNYDACNWLRQIQWSLAKGQAIKMEPTELDKHINQSPNFKKELYRTILQIISLPDKLIQFFTQSYIAKLDDVSTFSKFIIARKQQLKLAAKQIPAFNEYLQSDQAREEMLSFLNYLRTFKTMRKSFLLSDYNAQYKIDIESEILNKVIKEYGPIKNFAIKFDNYLEHLNGPIDFSTLGFNSTILSAKREKIISDILSLKEIINDYLITPSSFKKATLYSTLSDVVDVIKEEPITENFITSDLIESIKKIVLYKDHLQLKVIKKPIPTLKNNKTIPSLIPITFFNTKQPSASKINQPIPIQSRLSY